MHFGCLSIYFLDRSPYWRQIELLCKILSYDRKLRCERDVSGASALQIFAFQRAIINPLRTKRRLLYLKTQSVPRCKHFSTRL
jgi:hypothetical protein